MQEIIGTSDQVLEVNLTDRSVTRYRVSEELRRRYLGSKGLGLKLLYDRLEPGCDPLGPDNIIAFMPGVLMGTGAPCSGRFEALAKSPLTGIMGTSSCGGPFGMALKTAGWDGLLIRGRAESPCYLLVSAEGVEFRDAAELWGLEIPEAQTVLDTGKQASVVIGPAGENLVRFANLAAGHRFLGRGGLGAVMGSKNLKAVAALGGAFRIRPRDPQALAKAKKRGTKYINRNAISLDYRRFGTASNIGPCLERGIVPVNNFADGRHPEAGRLAGQAMAQGRDTKHATCKPCTILCGHSGVFGGQRMIVPEYETVGLLGSNLGVFDPEIVAGWSRLCSTLGIDTVSAGGTLGWVMEAAQKGLVSSELRFASPDGVAEALRDIAYQRGFGAEMALGSRALSEKYGGRDFAIQVKGLEMAAYDPRGSFGQGLAYAVANRGGCHLSSYLVAQEVMLGLLDPASHRGKARWVKFFEDLTCCVNALQTCQFTMYAYVLEPPLAKYTPRPLLAMLMQHLPRLAIPLVDYSLYTGLFNAVTGLGLSQAQFLRAGERIHVLERHMNCREGIDHRHDRLPARLLEQGRASDPEGLTVPLDRMLPAYYRLRGYDQQGVPTAETLQRLEIL